MTDKNNLPPENLTDEELADLVASKLVYFANALPGDDAAKQAFVDAVSEMSLEEAAKFCIQIEDACFNYQTRQLDFDLEAKLKEIKSEYENAKMDLAEKTLKDLKDLEAEIDELDQPK